MAVASTLFAGLSCQAQNTGELFRDSVHRLADSYDAKWQNRVNDTKTIMDEIDNVSTHIKDGGLMNVDYYNRCYSDSSNRHAGYSQSELYDLYREYGKFYDREEVYLDRYIAAFQESINYESKTTNYIEVQESWLRTHEYLSITNSIEADINLRNGTLLD